MSKKLDFNGKVFGRLIVIRELPERSKNRNVLWECLCDCGKVRRLGSFTEDGGGCACLQ